MIPFAAPLGDIEAALRLATEGQDLPDWDGDLARDVLGHFATFAEGVLAPIDETGDRQGCRIEGGRVRTPDGFPAAYAAYARDGWPGLTLPEAFGGQALSPLIGAGVTEVFAGANMSLQMVTGLVAGAARTILAFGNPDQQARWLPRLASGEILNTMCLTEPGAGSDLSRIRTRARMDGTVWRIDGEKTFISGGDQDLTKDILHFVLARTGDEAGVRGLSLFLCPSQSGQGRNAVKVTRIEDKMGLHASPTCHMVFDGAEAELLGAPGQGLRAMFTLMNHARIDVALQGVALASRAHHIASTYAADRKQGRGQGREQGREQGQAHQGPVTIDQHPAVRRMLEEQRALALGGRLMCLDALVALEAGQGPLADFLTPVCKVFGSQAGIRAADLGLQVLGGYGYLTEYRMEQIYRDARITAIYEGTNEIHALALAGRGLAQPGGAEAFEAYLAKGLDPATVARWTRLWHAVGAAGDVGLLADDFMQATARFAWLSALNRLDGTMAASLTKETFARITFYEACIGAKLPEAGGAACLQGP